MLPLLMSSPYAPKIVIDTQVVMDWLVFKDARVLPLVEAIHSGRVLWIGTPDMQAELLHVLGRGVAADRQPDLDAIRRTFADWCHPVELPPPAVHLRCRDPDDQIFIDLALAAKAAWLISRDKAVLALAKRARVLGPHFLTPEAWIRQQPPAH